MTSLALHKSASLLLTAARRHAVAAKGAHSVSRRPFRLVRLHAAAAGFEEAESSDVGEAEVAEATPAAEDAVEELVTELEVGAEEEEVVGVAAEESSPAVDRDVDCFSLNFLWLERNVGVAVDHWFTQDHRSPLTEYFFWPRTDAWEELKSCLESKPWISERDKVLLLNKTTEVINYWQDEGTKHTLEEATAAFPDCDFVGR